jgi:hypothetical protein
MISSGSTMLTNMEVAAMDRNNKWLPFWLWAVVLVQIVLVLVFSVGAALSPSDFISATAELNYLTQLYISRNVTLALGLMVALLMRSHQAIMVLLMVRVLTDVADIIAVYVFNVEAIKDSVPMVVFLLIVPAVIAIGYLYQRINPQSKG